MRIYTLLASIALTFCAGIAQADDYPSKPIRLIVPFSAGGASDSLARMLALHADKKLGHPMIVENRPGAGGLLAAQSVVRAAPDGYTLLFGTIGTNAVLPVLQPNVPFDPAKDFVAIAPLHELPLVMIINSQVPARSLQELISHAKSQREPLTYASSGIGSVQHLTGELFQSRANLDLLHVPFKGGGAGVPALLAGQVQVMFEPIPSALAAVQSQRAVALAVSSPKRVESWKSVPTFAEQNIEGMEVNAWTGLFAPAGVPEQAVTKLRSVIAELSRDPEYIAQLGGAGTRPVTTGLDEFPQFVANEIERWSDTAKNAGLLDDQGRPVAAQ